MSFISSQQVFFTLKINKLSLRAFESRPTLLFFCCCFFFFGSKGVARPDFAKLDAILGQHSLLILEQHFCLKM